MWGAWVGHAGAEWTLTSSYKTGVLKIGDTPFIAITYLYIYILVGGIPTPLKNNNKLDHVTSIEKYGDLGYPF